MASVTVNTVDKYYGSVQVLHGVSVDIKDGEFVVLVGPSGCGKSTLLRMIAGLEEISKGEISIGGRVVNDVAPKDRDIAMVFQNYALYPHMTVKENMAFSLKLAKAPKNVIDERVGRAAGILGLGQLLDRYPRQLSGGQRQRVAMGRAIVRDPQVFLFDEPLSNLDAKLRVQMRTEIKELHQRLKTTAVYVTHDQIEAMTMADRIVVMQGGNVEQVGAPLDLYDRPSNLFVAGFIGSPSMNFIDGTLRLNGGDGHGSNMPNLDLVARRTNLETDAECILAAWWNLLTVDKGFLPRWRQSKFPGGCAHACELETSLYLYLDGDNVRQDQIKNGTISFNAEESPFNWVDLFAAGPATIVSWTSSYSETGVLGEAELATAEKGREAFDEAVQQLARFVAWFKDRPKDPRRDRHRRPPTMPIPWGQRPIGP